MKTITKISGLAAILAALSGSSGCATVSGTVEGAVFGPFRLAYELDNPVFLVVGSPPAAIIGGYNGWKADMYLLKHNKYPAQWDLIEGYTREK